MVEFLRKSEGRGDKIARVKDLVGSQIKVFFLHFELAIESYRGH